MWRVCVAISGDMTPGEAHGEIRPPCSMRRDDASATDGSGSSSGLGFSFFDPVISSALSPEIT